MDASKKQVQGCSIDLNMLDAQREVLQTRLTDVLSEISSLKATNHRLSPEHQDESQKFDQSLYIYPKVSDDIELQEHSTAEYGVVQYWKTVLRLQKEVQQRKEQLLQHQCALNELWSNYTRILSNAQDEADQVAYPSRDNTILNTYMFSWLEPLIRGLRFLYLGTISMYRWICRT